VFGWISCATIAPGIDVEIEFLAYKYPPEADICGYALDMLDESEGKEDLPPETSAIPSLPAEKQEISSHLRYPSPTFDSH
jgi:hypothetical protein